MNWEAIGAISESLGAIAVFVTLGYLAIQIRHARFEARRALSQGRGEAVRELFALATDERINRLVATADATFGRPVLPVQSALIKAVGLTPEDAAALIHYCGAWWNYTLQIIPNAQELSDIERMSFDQGIQQRWGRPGVMRVFYEGMKLQTHPDAVRYIESVLAQPE